MKFGTFYTKNKNALFWHFLYYFLKNRKNFFLRVEKNPSNFLDCRESTKVSEIFLIFKNLKKSNCMQTVKTNNPIVWQTKSNCMQTVKTNNPIVWQTVKTNNPIGWQTKLKKKKVKCRSWSKLRSSLKTVFNLVYKLLFNYILFHTSIYRYEQLLSHAWPFWL